MELFDSHVHLQETCYEGFLKGILDSAIAKGVCTMSCCGTHPGDWGRVKRITDDNAMVIPSFGLHPWFVTSQYMNDEWLNQLSELVTKTRSGVGEIGLDFYESMPSRQAQETVFVAQLRLAKDLGIPFTLHCRKAWDRMITILAYHKPFPASGLIHSYSGSAELVPLFQAMNLFISFSGAVTQSLNKRVVTALKRVSDLHLLMETDSPALIPYDIPKRHLVAYNEPAYIESVCAAMARIRGQTPEAVAACTTKNARLLFL